MFEKEPPADWSLAQLPQVVATPHIAASTEEAQELVGLDTAAAVRDFLRDGIVRNAVNFPSVHPDELQRLQPWIRLADQPGGDRRRRWAPRASRRSALRYYGALAESRAADVLASSAAAGVLRPILSGGVSIVNARAAARERGIEIIESRSTRPRHFTSLVSLKLHTSDGERWAEGTVFEPNSPRLVSVRGVNVEAPLAGTMLIICNDDQPGVIGEVGTILGRHGVNIANFALGRNETGAIGVVNVDEEASAPGALDAAVDAIRQVPAVREAWVVRLPDVRSSAVTQRNPDGAQPSSAVLATRSRRSAAGQHARLEARASLDRLAVDVKHHRRVASMVARSIWRIDSPRTRSTPPVKSRGSATERAPARDAPRTPPDRAAHRRGARPARSARRCRTARELAIVTSSAATRRRRPPVRSIAIASRIDTPAARAP